MKKPLLISLAFLALLLVGLFCLIDWEGGPPALSQGGHKGAKPEPVAPTLKQEEKPKEATPPKLERPAPVEKEILADEETLAIVGSRLDHRQSLTEMIDKISPERASKPVIAPKDSVLEELRTKKVQNPNTGEYDGVGKAVDLVQGDFFSDLWNSHSRGSGYTPKGLTPGYARPMTINIYAPNSSTLPESMDVTIEELGNDVRYRSVATQHSMFISGGLNAARDLIKYPNGGKVYWLSFNVLLPWPDTDCDYLVYDNEKNPSILGVLRPGVQSIDFFLNEPVTFGSVEIRRPDGEPASGAMVLSKGVVKGVADDQGIAQLSARDPNSLRAKRHGEFEIYLLGYSPTTFQFYTDVPDVGDLPRERVVLPCRELRLRARLDANIADHWFRDSTPTAGSEGYYLADRWPTGYPKELVPYVLNFAKYQFLALGSTKAIPMPHEFGKNGELNRTSLWAWNQCNKSIWRSLERKYPFLRQSVLADPTYLVHKSLFESLNRGPTRDGTFWLRLPALAGEYLFPAEIGSVYDREGNDKKKDYQQVKFFRIEGPREALDSAPDSGPILQISESDIRAEYQVIRTERNLGNYLAWLRYYFGERGAKAERGVPKNPKPEPWPAEK